MKISSIGEFGLIERVTKDLTYYKEGLIKGIGDDTAVLRVAEGKSVLFTTDMLVEDIHFSRDWATLEQIGWKAVVVNVSDIAAMGGIPAHAAVAIGIPEQMEVADIEEIYRGMRRAASVYKMNIVGGDTVKCPPRLVINVSLMGEVEQGRAVLRSGARSGDLVFVTGPLGGSAAGLQVLLNNIACREETKKEVINYHLEPKARVAEGNLLQKSGVVTAMNDISDGLASELHEICRASHTGFIINRQAIPIAKSTREIAACSNIDPTEWALYGGEDFELVFTITPGSEADVKALFQEQGLNLYKIGLITEAEKGFVMTGGPEGEVQVLPKGYNHFT